MSEPLRISFPYSAEQHASAIEDTKGYRFLRRFLYACGGIYVLIGVVGIVVATAVGGMPVTEAVGEIGPLVPIGVLSLFGPAVQHRFSRWWLAGKRPKGDDKELRVFSEEGFIGSSHWTQPVPWFLVNRVVETRNYFLVYAAPEGPSYVPKASLEAAELGRLRELLESNSKRTGMTVSNEAKR